MHLKAFGWEPIVLTVHENNYEEPLDWNLHALVDQDLRIEKVSAMKITKPRLIGDIGLRAFMPLYKRAKELIKNEKIDFLYITIPSYYAALLGRLLNRATYIKYGIDYQDPWVHKFPGSNRLFSRHWFATKVSRILEPIAVKNASLITGVSEGYYEDVIKRNRHLEKRCIFGNLPIGTEPSDHETVKSLDIEPFLFRKEPGKVKLVYAGTMLPKAYEPFEMVCKALSENKSRFKDLEIHFIGSGSNTRDQHSYNVKDIAEKYGLWQNLIFEYPARIPYLDTLIHLAEADGIFILGSTETHYSPSKVYQGIASGKYLFAILHARSTAVNVINKTQSGVVLTFDGENDLNTVYENFTSTFSQYLAGVKEFVPSKGNLNSLEPYFAKSITGNLASLLHKVVPTAKTQKQVLIISPHFPPSNLTAVHRARLFSQHLPDNGWAPVILTVHEQYYEEKLDINLFKIVSNETRIEKVKAARVKKPRIIGDIGLRAFLPMYRKAKEIIKAEDVDFLYIIIPSFYGALWGRMLHRATRVPYGIDYIDPWVHRFPGSHIWFSRAWFATAFSKILEPIAVKDASLITGVAESYYQGIFKRNKKLAAVGLTLPPASEVLDFQKVRELQLEPYLFEKKESKIQLVFAGAMQPSSFLLFESICDSIAGDPELFSQVEFHFIGTGLPGRKQTTHQIKPIAEKYQLWNTCIYEYPERIPYLDVLVHLQAADGVFILGSTEAHYTPSKVNQAILSGKPIFAVLHNESPGTTIINEIGAGIVMTFDGKTAYDKIATSFCESFLKYLEFFQTYQSPDITNVGRAKHSAEAITRTLARQLSKIINPDAESIS